MEAYLSQGTNASTLWWTPRMVDRWDNNLVRDAPIRPPAETNCERLIDGESAK